MTTSGVDLLLGRERTPIAKKARRRAAFAVALRHEGEFIEAYRSALKELRAEQCTDRRAEV